MKTKTIFKTLGVIAITALLSNRAEAQRTATAAAATDFTKSANAAPGVRDGAVRVIDNKGTIKFLQTKNGLTMLTNSTNDVTTTTWQLGGTLTDDTYIDVSGKTFGFDRIDLVGTSGTAASNAPANFNTTALQTAADKSVHAAANPTGWTFLVRDEQTGAIRKMQASDLGVNAITTTYTQAANATGNVTIPVAGLPIIAMGSALDGKLAVYRNGVKLRNGAANDFTVLTAGNVIINYSIADIPMYSGDVIEIQYIR